MKATELRIGNLVTYNYNQSHRFPESELKYSGTAYPVIAIAEDDILIKGFAGKCESFSPIPLTEEWLIKFGFITLDCEMDYIEWGLDDNTNGAIFNIQSDGLDKPLPLYFVYDIGQYEIKKIINL